MDNDKIWKQAVKFPQSLALEFNDVMPIIEDWKGKKILDYGCGGGRDALELAIPGAKVYGVDISKSNIKNAKKLFKDNKLKGEFKLINEGDDIPYPDDFFDGVVCNGVMHHIEEPNKPMSEISRTLKKKGIMYLMLYTEELFRMNMNNIENMLKNRIGRTWQNCFGEITDRCMYSTFYTISSLNDLSVRNKFKLLIYANFHLNQFRIHKLENNK